MEMKSPKYTAYPSFVPYGSFYSGYMPMAYKSENMMHYPYPTLRSPPTPSDSPMSLTSPNPFSPLPSPLSRPSPNPLVRPSANHPTSYFSNQGVLTPITPPSSTYPHHQNLHQSYFSTEAHTHGQTTMAANVPAQLQFTTEWPRPLPAPQVP